MQVEELMSQETEELTLSQKENYEWTEKLFVDHKVRQFVSDKLLEIYGKNSPQLERRQNLSHPSTAASPPPLLSSQIIATSQAPILSQLVSPPLLFA